MLTFENIHQMSQIQIQLILIPLGVISGQLTAPRP